MKNNQRIKEYELKLKAELQSRENDLFKREQKLIETERDYNLKSEEISYKNQNNIKNEYNDIVRQLRSMDTRKHDDVEFISHEDTWNPNNRIKSPDLFINGLIIDEQHPDMLKSLEPDEFHFGNIDSRFAQNVEQVEIGTYMTPNNKDQSINATKEMKTASFQVSSISQEDVDKMSKFEKQSQEFQIQKQEFEKHMIHEHSILDKRKIDLDSKQSAQNLKIDQLQKKISELDSTLVSVLGKNSELEKAKQKYLEMESKLDLKYSEMKKDIAIREREREMEYLQRKQEMDEREDRINKMYKDFDITKEKEMFEISKKIRTTHELIKTVMHLHQDDISSFEGGNVFRHSGSRALSFDISKQSKVNDSQNSNRDSDEKDKVIN